MIVLSSLFVRVRSFMLLLSMYSLSSTCACLEGNIHYCDDDATFADRGRECPWIFLGAYCTDSS